MKKGMIKVIINKRYKFSSIMQPSTNSYVEIVRCTRGLLQFVLRHVKNLMKRLPRVYRYLFSFFNFKTFDIIDIPSTVERYSKQDKALCTNFQIIITKYDLLRLLLLRKIV